ncbi:serine protease [Yoonia sp.]|uniref:serine protease n=1 Tax=Yoonia sp. TaxID=2212373 RepID=UPI003F6CEDDC
MIRSLTALFLFVALTVPAAAQDRFWIQIEARQTLTGAQDSARTYAAQLDGVHGFYLGDGFYGIVIGPFDAPQAQATLAQLLDRGAVPADSFVKSGQFFRQQFWPVGGGQATTPPTGDPIIAAPPVTPADLPRDPTPETAETPQQARAAEGALSGEARAELQRALKWAGFYQAAIDGVFGRGTRAAMQAWQRANGLEPTGVLTSRQRDRLLQDYNSILEGMNLRLVRDTASGIQMLIPTDVVAFTEYQPPFVHFEASGDIAQAKVMFISQAGDMGKLTGLYEVLQILDLVPPDGARGLTPDSFEIEGIGNGIHSYATATLQDGAIKGFMLVWPDGDNARRKRVLDEMRASFERLDGVLDPMIVPAPADQTVDMVAGLSVRQPQLSRSGFYVTNDGAVITTPEAVQNCARITIDREHEATVSFTDDALGIALLRPTEALAPLGVATFQTGLPRLQDRIAVAGYPFNGALGAPTLTFGQVVDIRGLTGDARFSRLAILPQGSDAGGPVFSEGGTVLGMLLPRAEGAARILPAEVNFAIDADQIVTALQTQGIEAQRSTPAAAISPVALTRQAADVAVLISCW